MRALGGGLSGAAAMVLQVLLLMPIRTIMNYQYRHGTSLTVATKTLYQDGGYGRYYAGMGAALFQGKSPLTAKSVSSLWLNKHRTDRTFRRYGSQRGNSGSVAVEWISIRATVSHQNHLRFTMCGCIQDDPYANRHFEDHSAS